ncbi:MAG: GGDEF domain-containing protein [Myxococcota bacterium]|nr:GGDEF domain-containing protein [Myxococcota bacterium]
MKTPLPLSQELTIDKEQPQKAHSFERKNAWSWRFPLRTAIVGVFLVLIIGILDYYTGANVSLALLYLLPVTAAGWFVGRRVALLLAALAAVAWFVPDYLLHDAGYLPVSFWNAVTIFCIFGGMGLVMTVLREERDRLRVSLERLADLAEREAHAARTDPLTGLQNARAFHESLERAWAGFLRHGQPLALAFIDLDNFKIINDRHGHAAGDELLDRLANELHSTVRKEDIAGRLGGDEFAVLLPGATIDSSRQVMRRFQERVQTIADDFAESGLGVSIGLAAATPQMESSQQLLKAADLAMYQVKASGKDGMAVDYGEMGQLTVLHPNRTAKAPVNRNDSASTSAKSNTLPE